MSCEEEKTQNKKKRFSNIYKNLYAYDTTNILTYIFLLIANE